MSDFIKEGEQFLEGQEGNQSQGNAQNDSQDQSQQRQGGQQDQQGGSTIKNFEQNTGDAYVNQEVNGFLTKEGVPSALDGAIDGVVDTEANNLEKDF